MKKVFWLLVMGAVASAAMAIGLGRAAQDDAQIAHVAPAGEQKSKAAD